MAKTRALMTDTERERLAGLADVEEIKVYQAKSRVRRRIDEELRFDLEILRENHPDLFEELCEVVDDERGRQRTDDRVEEGDALERAKGVIDETDTVDADAADVASVEPADDDTDDKSGLDVDGVSDRVSAAVRDVAASWSDTDERLVKRRWAAERALQHAIDTGDAVGKSDDVVEQLFDENPVDGQNYETYWRKNIRPVLKEYGQYSQAQHGYIVDNLEGDYV